MSKFKLKIQIDVSKLALVTGMIVKYHDLTQMFDFLKKSVWDHVVLLTKAQKPETSVFLIKRSRTIENTYIF